MLLHPADLPVWQLTHADPPDGELADGQQIAVGRHRTAGHPHPRPRARRGVLLLPGPRGGFHRRHLVQRRARERPDGSFSDYDVIVRSITERLLALPEDTVVKTGHGEDTTIAAERENILAGGGFA